MEWILLLALFGSTSRVPANNDAGIRVIHATDNLIFAWSYESQIKDIRIDGLSAWSGYWSTRDGNGLWSVSLLEPKADAVLQVQTVDLLNRERVYTVDRYGFQVYRKEQ